MNFYFRLSSTLLFVALYSTLSIAQYTPSDDTNIDIDFAHIDIEVGIDTSSIRGNVELGFSSTIDNLSEITIDMGSNLVLDSIENDLSYVRDDNHLTIELGQTLSINENQRIRIYYHSDDLEASFKGVRYEEHQGVPVIATLSTPYIGHVWYPIKDGTSDKIDSVFMDIKIENRDYDETPLRAVATGVLVGQTNMDTHTQYHYEHRYPITPFYVMFAISNFVDVRTDYTSINGDVFPIVLNTFPNNIDKAEDLLVFLAQGLDHFEDKYGAYPFSKEQLGFTELGFYGGIENQTNIVVNRYSTDFYNVIIHELAHMWFACSLTCETWHEGWLNEGFATYMTGLFREDAYGPESLDSYMLGAEFYQGGTLYRDNIDDPFTVFASIIYNKGAWVLHMLRAVMGDEDFFEAVNTYSNQTNLQYSTVTLEDFKSICEDVDGQNLDWFFDQWINEEFYPNLKYNYVADGMSIDITLQQSQVNSGHILFEMPLEVKINFEDNTFEIVTLDFFDFEHNYHLDFDENISSIELDPRNVLLDKHAEDNSIFVNNENLLSSRIKVFPNPVSQSLLIDDDQNTINQIILSDQHGRVILTTDERTINLELMKPGIYYLKILLENQTLIKKIIKI